MSGVRVDGAWGGIRPTAPPEESTPAFQRRLDTAGVTTWFTLHPTLTAALTR
ncbi:hypothetical protein [Streptomyces sp. adm13(2018)]|uniref:hypothetical protein n=1 Tax=Streptomyces sp. adm13(2018) TaxID=2479007 RepID=UPI00164F6939|nr:hypothetical protein [Streptomyces sp. adm13(2018)]